MKSGRFDPKRDPHVPHQSHRERAEQAASARKQQVEARARQLAEQAAKSEAERAGIAARPVRSSAAYRTALAGIPFSRAGETVRLSISEPYQRLVDIAVRCIEERIREPVLCWPEFEASPAAIVAFMTLADNAATPMIKHDALDARGPPLGMRALIYPYTTSVHRPLRRIYVDKEAVGRLHTQHQVRTTRQGEDPALADYHKAVARAKTLTGKALDGNIYDEFQHPCLDELLPSGPCSGSDGRKPLLWRVKSKTDLRNISRSGQADDPATARFYLFGIRSTDNIPVSLKALRRKLDTVFLDLSQTGRNRLGRDWEAGSSCSLLNLSAMLAALPCWRSRMTFGLLTDCGFKLCAPMLQARADQSLCRPTLFLDKPRTQLSPRLRLRPRIPWFHDRMQLAFLGMLRAC